MPNRNDLNKALSFEITRMTEEFIRQVKEIEIRSGLSPWTFEDYKKEILRKDSVCLVAKRNRRVIGFIIARLIMQEINSISQNESVNTLPKEAEIYNLAVLEAARNKGIGKALLRQFLLRAQEYKISDVWLEVRESNFQAIGFYEKHGFLKTQVRKNFYQFPTEDGVLMKLEIMATEAGEIL